MFRLRISVFLFCLLSACLVQVAAGAQGGATQPFRAPGNAHLSTRVASVVALAKTESRFGPSNAVSLNSARQSAVTNAWKQERILVQQTGQGTRLWTNVEKKELLATGKIKGYEGHHINDASTHPKLAGKPDNIKFVKGRQEHIREHAGSFRNSTRGRFISRQKMLQNYRWSISNQNLFIGGVQAIGGGFLIWQFLPGTLASSEIYLRGDRQDNQLFWKSIDSSLFVASGTALSVSGTARIAAYAVSSTGFSHMHSILGGLRMATRVAGPIAAVLFMAESGVYTYRWNRGYISTPMFVERMSITTAGVGGVIAGGKVGATIGQSIYGVEGGAIGGVVGGILGGVGGVVAASDFVEERYGAIDQESQEAFLDHLYSSYGQERRNGSVVPELAPQM